MGIREYFIRGNRRIELIGETGEPTAIPPHWQPILGDCDVLVAIPDMHMFFFDSPQDNFRYGAEAMQDLLAHLLELRTTLAAMGKKLRVFQLGDMFDLLYPHPMARRKARPGEIENSHPLYRSILKSFRELNSTFILGNHDFDCASDGVPFSVRQGQVHLEHGFAADAWYQFTNPHCRGWRAMMALLGFWRLLESSLISVRLALGGLKRHEHYSLGVVSGETERVEVVRDYPDHHLDYYSRLVSQDSGQPEPTRLCITAHTHRPRIDVDFANGQCVFADAGAWTEGRSDFLVVTNEEIANCRYRRLTERRVIQYMVENPVETAVAPQLAG